MKHQRGFIPVEWIIYGLIAIAIASVGGYAVYIYKDRQSLKRELKLCSDLRAADIEAAIKETAARQAKEDAKSEAWRKYVLSEQEQYEAKLAAAGKFKPGGVYHDPASDKGSGRAEEAGKGNPEVPANPAAGSELSGVATAFLQSEALRADQAAVYAAEARDVALACIADLNAK